MGTITANAFLTIQYTNGELTPTGLFRRRSQRFGMREDAANEHCHVIIDAFKALTTNVVVGAKLTKTRVNLVMGSMTLKESQLRRLKEEQENEGMMQRASVSQMSAHTATTSSVSASVQATTAPAATAPVSPVQSVPAILGEERRPRIETPAAKEEKISLFQRIRDFFIDDSYQNQTPVQEQETMLVPAPTAEAEIAEPEHDYSHLVKDWDWNDSSTWRWPEGAAEEMGYAPHRPDPATEPNFMTRMRRNGYKVTPEEMMRSPFENTVTQKGGHPLIKKLDVPLIYVDN